jgi:hypothetical protein
MAITSALSIQELSRVAALAYQGKTIRVSLAVMGTSGFTEDSTTAEWDSVKVSGAGYSDFVTTLPEGGWDPGEGRFEIGEAPGPNTFLDALFAPAGNSFTYDCIYVVVDEDPHIHSLMLESPPVTLSDGQTITYRIQLVLST